MKPINRIFLFFLSLALPGCYEGWKNPKKNLKPPSGTSDSSRKPYRYIFVHAIFPSDNAIEALGCDVDQVRKIQKSEWFIRRDAIYKMTDEISDKVDHKDVRLDPDDCLSFKPILQESLSLEILQNLSSSGASPDPQDQRPILHLRVVFWDQQFSNANPPGQVTAKYWSSFQKIADIGLKVKSANYFVIPPKNLGYFSKWNTISASNILVAKSTYLNPLDASKEGYEKRNKNITADVEQLKHQLENYASKN